MHHIFDQGHFDGMCGNYSIVNSISYTTSISRKHCQTLFREIYALASDISPSVAVNGLYFYEMEQIVSGIDVPGVKITIPFRSLKFDSIGDFYTAVASHINDKRACAIIGLGKPVHHWTVAKYVHPRTISLIDSGGRKHIKSSRAALVSEKGKVRLHPRQTIIFERVP